MGHLFSFVQSVDAIIVATSTDFICNISHEELLRTSNAYLRADTSYMVFVCF